MASFCAVPALSIQDGNRDQNMGNATDNKVSKGLKAWPGLKLDGMENLGSLKLFQFLLEKVWYIYIYIYIYSLYTL